MGGTHINVDKEKSSTKKGIKQKENNNNACIYPKKLLIYFLVTVNFNIHI